MKNDHKKIIRLAKRAIACIVASICLSVSEPFFGGSVEPNREKQEDAPLSVLRIPTTHTERSLAYFTRSQKITALDLISFYDAVKRGAQYAYDLFFEGKDPVLSDQERTTHLHAITDLISFFYFIAMLNRDDRMGPQDLTFGIYDETDRLINWLNKYRALIKDEGYSLGSPKNFSASNSFAYFRKQSHGFVDSWGIDIRLEKDSHCSPLFFNSRWKKPEEDDCVGPLRHILVGTDEVKKHKHYIKPESHGLYDWGDLFGHTKGYLAVIGRRTPFISYLFDRDDDPLYNREHTPLDAIRFFRKNTHYNPETRTAIQHGIGGMYSYAKENCCKKLVNFFEESFDFPALRHGREIIITTDTIFWADYFRTSSPELRKFYEEISVLKRIITELGTQNPPVLHGVVQNHAQYVVHLYEHNKSKIENQKIRSYCETIMKLISKFVPCTDQMLATFLKKHHRQVFDSYAYPTIEVLFDHMVNRPAPNRLKKN